MRALASVALAGLLAAACAPGAPPAPPSPPPPPAPGEASALSPVGPEWLLESMFGAPVVAGSKVTMTLAADGNVSGTGGCNRYFTNWKMPGGGKIIMGKGGSTMMACMPEAVMKQEQAFLLALETASAYAFASDGSLIITTARGPLNFRKGG